jgi:sulfite exporter TauE/SafE
MTDLPFIFMGGLIGSSHCIGMCGPLALAVGITDAKLTTNLRRQLVFSAGRICTYGFAGAVAAFTGLWLAQWSWLAVGVQAGLAVIGGAALVVLGLSTLGFLPRLSLYLTKPQPCAFGTGVKTLLTSPRFTGAFLAGVFTGFIPCGLVYAFLATAASSGDVVRGWLVMVTFGAGTVPLLVVAGCGSTLLSVATRSRMLRLAAWCVVITGVISIARGIGYMELSPASAKGSCPFCHPAHYDTPLE